MSFVFGEMLNVWISPKGFHRWCITISINEFLKSGFLSVWTLYIVWCYKIHNGSRTGSVLDCSEWGIYSVGSVKMVTGPVIISLGTWLRLGHSSLPYWTRWRRFAFSKSSNVFWKAMLLSVFQWRPPIMELYTYVLHICKIQTTVISIRRLATSNSSAVHDYGCEIRSTYKILLLKKYLFLPFVSLYLLSGAFYKAYSKTSGSLLFLSILFLYYQRL